MEEKILDFIMEYAQENEGVPFQVIEENFNIVMDDKLKDIISVMRSGTGIMFPM